MKLHPFYECAEAAEELMAQGFEIFQQFNCATCGNKQTMNVPDKFYKKGRCEECGATTDIEHDGCNYMVKVAI